MKIKRRSFLAGSAFLAAAGMAPSASGMLPSEQAAHDKYKATEVPHPDQLLDSESLLQVPAPDSVGVSFAVNRLAVGYAEVADNPEMTGAKRYVCAGMPLAEISDRVLRVRMDGLKPATRYWYRIGAAAVTYPVGYWMKPSPIEWGALHTFSTPGEGAESRFAVINDTHARWEPFERVVAKLRELKAPVTVWNGDAQNTSRTREDLVNIFLKPKAGAGYATDAPILFNNGNHDFRGQANIHLDEVLMTRLPTERAPRDWALGRNFAIRQGQIALIGLDTGEDKPDFHPAAGGATRFEPYRAAQALWLEDQFKRPEIASAPYVVAFVHIPLFDPNPNANPGTLLEDYAAWQKQAAELWGPILTKNRVQVVIAAHQHQYRFDPATPDRTWAQMIGGGPDLQGNGRFPTVIEGLVADGKLVIRAHDVRNDRIAGEHAFEKR
ncbi:MAG: metallophosphoesterase [Kiritimatiellae bacterium]|nr:metallophosphoesterase [Kiritimatiellia bacterium]